MVATVACHYMTSLDQRSWAVASTWPIRDALHPQPWLYASDDPSVFHAHDAEAARRGFVWLWSWWGRGPAAGGDSVLRHYLDSGPDSPIQVMILYEATGLLTADRDGFFNFDDPGNYKQFVSDMAYLDGAYFGNPRYAHRFFRIDGRAVVFPWVSRNFTGAWPAAVTAARGVARFFLVGSEFGLGLAADGTTPTVRRNLAQVVAPLDAVSAYGIYDPAFVPPSGRLDASYASRYDAALRGWAELLGRIAPGVAFVPPLQFAFDDRYYRPEARHPPLVSGAKEAYAVASVTRRLLDDARAGDPRYRNVLPLVLCVSWNEHVEGSAIEDTVEHGYGYLELTSVAFRA